MQSFNSHQSPDRLKRILFTIPFFLLILAYGATAPAQQVTAPVGQTESLEPGDTTRSIVYAGVERTYLLHVPAGYDAARAMPMVLAFHGIGLNDDEMVRISGFSEKPDTSGFIIAYPNGTGEKKSWNGDHCCGGRLKSMRMMSDSSAR